jgi:hypothetical protein
MFRESTHRSLTKYSSHFCQQHRSIALCCCWFVKQRFDNGQGREYWMILEGQAFLRLNDSAPRPLPSRPLPFSRQQVVSPSQSSCVSPVEHTDGKAGWGGTNPRESLPLYTSFNTLRAGAFTVISSGHTHKSPVGFAKDRAYSCTA